MFVGDRSNGRVQVFEPDGTFVAEWGQFGRPSGMFIDEDDVLYVTDSTLNARNNPGFDRGIYIGSAVDGTVHAYILDPLPGRCRPAAHPEVRRAVAGRLVLAPGSDRSHKIAGVSASIEVPADVRRAGTRRTIGLLVRRRGPRPPGAAAGTRHTRARFAAPHLDDPVYSTVVWVEVRRHDPPALPASTRPGSG